jgi:formamidopyrimidine-DNA glycosylase
VPELPEVETVRRGLQAILPGRRIEQVQVFGTRTTRRQAAGPSGLQSALAGARVATVARRGKYLWWTLEDRDVALVAHLGMSGQFRTVEPGAASGARIHERARFELDDGSSVAFLDQRTFGWLLADDLCDGVPAHVAHIALDPFDPDFDLAVAAARLRTRRTGIKRALLDQTLVSGIGNIYADETLWRVRMHPDQATDALSARRAREVIAAAAQVMAQALQAGGTSFDPLYVHVNGSSGWFAADLAVYGRAGEPCRRCGRPVLREAFANRSSHRCPRCQRLPLHRR